jgi:hypothetical protein
MYSISDQQIDFILSDLHSKGIKIEGLQSNLLDHICILIEQNLEQDEDFEQYYSTTLKTFYQKELREIEEETLFLLRYKNHLRLSRNQFFLLLFIVFIGPFIGCDLLGMIGWVPTLIYSLWPLLTLLVLFLTPERFDPLLPKKSKVLLGFRPLIKLIPQGSET